jgi:GNAT superfamily N-acetyltransferase
MLAAGTATSIVVGSEHRDQPGWDGLVHPVAGVVDPAGGTLVSLPPRLLGWAQRLVDDGAVLDDLRAALPTRLGSPGGYVYRAVYRWAVAPVPDLADAGVWVPVEDASTPDWLHPFGGEALLALDGDGTYLAGVGLKRHDRFVHEIAVGTDEAARGRGLARRLVAQAARELLARGVTPTYMHDPANVPSARVAEAAGFPDRGWSALGFADDAR